MFFTTSKDRAIESISVKITYRCNFSDIINVNGPTQLGAIFGRSRMVRLRYFRALTYLLAVGVSLATLPGCGVNKIPTLDEQVKAAWSEVLNQYQRLR